MVCWRSLLGTVGVWFLGGVDWRLLVLYIVCGGPRPIINTGRHSHGNGSVSDNPGRRQDNAIHALSAQTDRANVYDMLINLTLSNVSESGGWQKEKWLCKTKPPQPVAGNFLDHGLRTTNKLLKNAQFTDCFYHCVHCTMTIRRRMQKP